MPILDATISVVEAVDGGVVLVVAAHVCSTRRPCGANISVIADLTLNRLDSSFPTGTRFEGELTELEMRWGTIGQLPNPYTSANPS